MRYVPNLKINLISLNTLESHGYRFIGEDGVLKVCKGSLVILKGHRKVENMYFLEGSIVTGNVVVVVKSTQSDENITKL